MKAKKFLLAACSLTCGFCLTLPGLANATQAQAESTSETSWILERTDAAAYSTANYRCVQLFTSFDAAPQFNGTEAYWGFSVKNHLSSEAMIRFGYSMGGGVTVWMGGPKSIYYLVDEEGDITKLQGTAGQNIKVPENFEGKVFWNPAEGYGYTNNTEKLEANKYRVKGLQVGYDFRSAYSAKLEFSNLYVADFTVDNEEVTISNLAYKGDLDVLDTDYPKWANLGTPSGEGLTAMQEGVTISQVDLNGSKEYVSIAVSGATDRFDIGETFNSNGLIVKGTTSDGKTYIIPSALCNVDSSQVNTSVSGPYNVTVSFGTLNAQYSVTINEDYIVSIEATGGNCKYIEGDTFNDDTLTVNAVYASGKKEALGKSAYQVDSSAVNTSVPGEYTVTVNSREFSCDYKINVYDNAWVFYNRLDNKKVDGNTYHGAYLQTEPANGTPLTTQKYLGIRIKNLLPYSNTRIRFGFTYYNGTKTDVLWIFGSGTYYTVDTQGNVGKDEITGQYLFPKANFEGWIFVDTTNAYGKEKYKGEAFTGIIVGYDFRSTYTCSLGFNSIGAADFVESGDTITMSGFRTLAYFGDMDINDVKQIDINGKPSDEQFASAVACISFNKVPAELIAVENVTALEIFTEPKKKQYTIDDTELDLTGGVAIVTYSLGEYTVQQRFKLSDSIFTVSGFTAGTKGEQTVSFSYAEKTVSLKISVEDAGDLIPVGIAIKTMPVKLDYLVNEQADWTGGVITITFASGKTEDVGFDDERLTIVGFSTLSAREKMNVYVTLADDSTISASFKINVKKPEEKDDSSAKEEKKGCGSTINGTALLAGAIVLAAAIVVKKRKNA